MKDTAKAFLHFAIAFAVIFTSAFAGTAVTFNGSSYTIPSAGETNWSSLSNFLISVANNAQTINKQVGAIRIATSTPVTVTSTDFAIITNMTVASAVSVSLPAGVTGQRYIIVDGKGDAATNNVTITSATGQLINNGGSHLINEARGGVTLQFDGTVWRPVEDYVGENPKFSAVTAISMIASGSLAAGNTAITGTLDVTGAASAASLGTSGNISAGGRVISGLNSASAPAYTASVGTSGIYFPDATTIGFATGSASRGTINSSGVWNVVGSLTVGGVAVPTISSTDTLTNKTLTSPTITGATVTTGSINNTPIGASTPSTGAFTTLSSSGVATLGSSSHTGTHTVNAGVTVFRNSVNTGYSSVRLYNDLNSSARALEIDYSGSSHAGALLTGGPSGESAAIVTTGAFPLSFGANNSYVGGYSSAGAWTLGPASGAATHTFTSGGSTNLTITGAAATTMKLNLNVGAGGNASIQFGGGDATFKNSSAGDIGTVSQLGAWTLGASTGGSLEHIAQSNGSTQLTVKSSASNVASINLRNGTSNKWTFANIGSSSDELQIYGGGSAGTIYATANNATGAWAFGPTSGAVFTVNGQTKYNISANNTGGTYNNFALPAGSAVLKFTNGGTLTGITGGTDGKIIYIVNVLATTLTIENGSIAGVGGTGSTAANRILTGSGADVSITAEGGATLIYDATDSRWRVISLVQ